MPKYGMPGVAVDRRRSLLVGAVAVGVIVAVVAAVSLYRGLRGDDGLYIALHTEQIGDGVLAGTPVRVDGVQVGTVTDIVPDEDGTQRISLRLDRSQLFGIDDSLQVDYAPANLFGISEIELRRGTGGTPLRDDGVIDLTGRRSAAIFDATMGSLLRSLSQTGDAVLTPQMATVISQVSNDVDAFTPLAQALITVAQTITDNQKMPASELVGRLGPAFDGGGQFAGATIQVLDLIRDLPRLQDNRAPYDAGVQVLTDQLLPGLGTFAGVAGDQLSGTTTMLAPVLALLGQMVPRPQQSGADLAELMARLRTAMPDTPNGPVLNTEIDVRGVPVLAPLLGGPR
ncbi:ABC-type transporter Mla subunit MlaD [Nocardia transvalensis]|uniref:ABC-type transporter Mla subunit MlaD n=1 Tax=Nocardia transvalensis TaxID=37333 RepID=A0A7W9PF98_9NOCA|nr:MlaD family protein [Nocardia transvalensis]MBB5915012.1 ABC-type transporter Mla subunit MlaD [Nocardia transvalensis]